MRHLSTTVCAFVVVATAMAGCSSSTTGPPVMPLPQHLYVATDGATVVVYTLPITNSSTPLLTLSGFTDTRGVALDSLGHLFVDDDVIPATISEFALPITASSTPIATIHTPAGTDARSIAVDASNNLWVPALSGSLYEFVGPFSGSVTPAPTITISNSLNGPEGLAFDSLHNLYAVNNGGTTVSIFNAPQVNAQVVSSSLAGILGDSRGVAIDGVGHAYVLEDVGNIQYFAGPAPFPNGTVATFTDPSASTGVTFGGGLSVDMAGDLYACDFTSGLYVFANAQTTFSATSTPSAHLTGGCSNTAAGS